MKDIVHREGVNNIQFSEDSKVKTVSKRNNT